MSRVAIITGASRGIGAATARVLAERGFRVVVNYHSSAEEAAEVVAAITAAGGEAVATRADVTVPDDVSAMVGDTEERWGRVDELTWEQLGGKLDRELHAAFLLTKGVVPGMTSRGYGRLLYLTAEPSRHPRNGMINLGVPKAAMNQFARYIALELAPHGITANLVAPATVQGTSMNQKLTPEQLGALSAAAPMGRLVTPDEVAKTLAFLASEDSGFTTGHYFPLDGGLTMD
jgi:NAD(P)-dependent dehydrogenase (short-subunit alcohol dehydrogenase family)